jgi:hypothetical protein
MNTMVRYGASLMLLLVLMAPVGGAPDVEPSCGACAALSEESPDTETPRSAASCACHVPAPVLHGQAPALRGQAPVPQGHQDAARAAKKVCSCGSLAPCHSSLPNPAAGSVPVQAPLRSSHPIAVHPAVGLPTAILRQPIPSLRPPLRDLGSTPPLFLLHATYLI